LVPGSKRVGVPDFVNQGIQFQIVYQLVAEITVLFERLVAELPVGTAVVHASQVSAGAWIDVKPTNPSSAGFSVLADDFELYSFHLHGSYWKFPWERRYRKGEKEIFTEIEEMARAVIAVDCEQRRRPFWPFGKINVGDYTYKTTNLPKLPIPPFWTRRYAAFVLPQPVVGKERKSP